MSKYSDLSDEELLRLLEQRGAPQASESGMLRGLGREFAAGGMLGWADEAEAALGAGMDVLGGIEQGVPFGQRYRAYQHGIEQERGRFQEEHPVASMAAGIAGGVAVPGGTAAQALPRGVLAAGTMGGAVGGVAGAGAAGPENRMLGTAYGSLAGVPLGVGGYLAGQGLSRLGGVLGRRLQGQQDGITNRPARVLRNVLEDAGETPDDYLRRSNELGPYSAAVDAGEGAQFLGQGLVTESPGARAIARGAMKSRAEGATDRVRQAVQDATGIRPQYGTSISKIFETARKRSQEAGPYYKAAMKADIKLTSPLKKALEDPAVQKAFSIAKTMARRKGVKLKEIYEYKDGQPVLSGEAPDMTSWQYIKEGLDSLLTGKRYHQSEPPYGLNKLGISTRDLRNEIVDELDRQNPIWKLARAKWAGNSSILKAIDEGRRAFNRPTAEVLQEVKGMSASEKEAYAVGMVESIMERIGRTQEGASQAKGTNFMATENALEKFRAVIGEQRANKLYRALEAERIFRETYADTLKNSQTELRKGATKYITGKGKVSIEDMAPEDRRRMISNAVNFMRSQFTSMPESERRKLAEMIFQPGGTQRAMRYLQEMGAREEIAAEMIARISAGAAAASAAVGVQ